MSYFVWLLVVSAWLTAVADACAQAPAVESKPAAPLRIGVVGLVHGHVSGFFRENLQRSDINLVGIAEPDQQLALQYAKRYGLELAEAYYVFTTLDVPGSTLTEAFGINDAGQIVGTYFDGAGTAHGFFLSGGSYTTLSPWERRRCRSDGR